MKNNKFRADQLIYEKGLAQSREKAKRLIMAGQVFKINAKGEHEPVLKPGNLLEGDAFFQIKGECPFVSRGGYKLLTAIKHFQLEVQNLTALDVGASTGGFTDCLLQHGAKKVYALDVGYGQLDWKLRKDPRVINLERTNIREVPEGLIPESVDLVVIDCSFISIKKVLKPVLRFLKGKGLILALIKPQFELSRAEVGKGVVRDKDLQNKAVFEVSEFVRRCMKKDVLGVVPAEIKGPKGNQEYLVLIGPK